MKMNDEFRNKLKWRVFTEEHIINLSLSHKWQKPSKKNLEILKIINTGRKFSDDTKEKIRQKLKNKPKSKEARENMSIAKKWKIPLNLYKMIDSNLWRECKEETRKKIWDSNRWEKSVWWRWWISKERYPIQWNNWLKWKIRERDWYVCNICSEKQTIRKHQVHHIDYNKENCNPENLITLCWRCHWKTNYNREGWIIYFNNKLNYECNAIIKDVL